MNRCALTRREWLDAIERALRHRCATTHEDERKVPTANRQTVGRPFRKPVDEKKKVLVKKTFRKSDVADHEDAGDEEDLEAEGATQDVFFEEDENDAHEEDETEMTAIPEEELEEEGDDPEDEEAETLEAYSAGWKAKAQVSWKKSRGWSGPQKTTSGGGSLPPSVAMKKMSHCALARRP